MIQRVEHLGRLFAIVIRSGYRSEGIEFFTPDEFSQQLAYMRRPAGYEIEAHIHNPVERSVELTQEVLIIRSGRVRVDLFDDTTHYLTSLELFAGDVVLLAAGGHGFHMIEDSEIIEIKQGPYAGEMDKTRFVPNTFEPLLRDN